MPGFGKSGTLRIFALSVVVIKVWSPWLAGWLRQYPKIVKASGGRRLVDPHRVHARSCGTAPDRALEAQHRVGIAFDLDFDIAVLEVPHGALEPLEPCRITREIAKAHALNPSGHD